MTDVSITSKIIYHPDSMETFKEHISKKKYHSCVKYFEDTYIKCDANSEGESSEESSSIKCDANSKRGRKPVSTKNTVQPFICQYMTLKDIPVEVMNAIEGVARLDWYARGDDLRQNVVAPNPNINHPFVTPWERVLIKCDANSKLEAKEEFTRRKYNDYGEWFLSPAGDTRKEYLLNLNKTSNNVDCLAVSVIVRVLREVSDINTRKIKEVLNIGKRQAERYNQACKIVIPFIEKAFLTAFKDKEEVLRKKYKKACLKDELPWSLEDEEYYLQGMFDSFVVDSIGSGISDYYHEDITGVYVPFEGVKLEALNTVSKVPFEEFNMDDYILMSDI